MKKKILLLCLILLGTISTSAKTRTPIGQEKWAKDILTDTTMVASKSGEVKKLTGMYKTDVNASTSIEGTWTFTFIDYYSDEILYIDFEATLKNNKVWFEDPTGREFPFIAEYDNSTNTLTFNREYLGSTSTYYVYQRPFADGYFQTITAIHRPSQREITFNSNNGIAWEGCLDQAGTNSAGYYYLYYFETAKTNKFKDDNGIFMGIISFNDKTESLPITILNEETKPVFTNFVNNMEMENATLLYYAVDQAITTLGQPSYPNNLTTARIITFTDGLDQGSLAMAPHHLTSRNYAQYLSDRISSTQIQGVPLRAYTIGLKSGDVADDELFMLNLESLASKPENGKEYAHSVADIEGVQKELTNIYEDLYKQTSKRVLNITVPMMSHGDTYRFTLDNTVDQNKVNDSKMWIEGVFNISDFSLSNLKYHGLTSSSGNKIFAERNGVYITFTFDDCRNENGDVLEIEKNAIDQWTYISSSNIWQHNVENDKDGKINIEDIRTSAAIMFVLDCSRSLGDLFPLLKQTANSFIERLAGGNTNSIDNVTIGNEDIDKNAPVEYYNLHGVRITNPVNGLYIRRQGNSTKKVLIK